jgi:hypothetical protein
MLAVVEPRDVTRDEEGWAPISTAKIVAVSVAIALLGLALLLSKSGFLAIIDHANLAFHEAGHLFYGVFGRTLALYGGTLGQLTFPAIALGIFLYRREAPSAALALAWIGENLFNVARYMADARAQVLPLVGGGEHDWAMIFSRWGAIHSDTRVAMFTRLIGGVLIGLGWAWVAWRWWRGRSSLGPAAR